MNTLTQRTHRPPTRSAARWPMLLVVALLVIGGCTDPDSTDPGEEPCPDGSDGCPCYANDTCDRTDEGRLQCVDGTCQPEVATVGQTVTLEAEDARGCDLLLEGPEASLRKVTFPDAVQGQHIGRDGRLAISLVPREDRPLRAEVAVLEVPADADLFEVRQTDCFDRQGRPLDSASASIHDTR